jgi:hypothetical protein
MTMQPAIRWVMISLVSAAMAWSLLTVAAYGYVKFHRQITTVEYLDILLPKRWPEFQIKRGEHLIGVGLTLLANGKFNEGYYQLRAGLLRAPGNMRGRLALAQILNLNKRPDLAQTTLLDGLFYHSSDPEYVSTVMTFLSEREEDQLVVELCTKLLGNPASAHQVKNVAALSAASARYQRGDYDQSETFLVENNVSQTPKGRLLLAQCEWERGYRELALLALRKLSRDLPADEGVYSVLSGYLRANGQNAEAQQLAVLHQIAAPKSIRSHIDQLTLLLSEGNDAALDVASRQAIALFRDDPAAILALGDFAASYGRVNLARDILTHFTGKHWENETAARLIYIEALLVAKQYREAQVEIQSLLTQTDISEVYLNIANGFLALAQYGLGDAISAHASLNTMMDQPKLRADSLLAMANRLFIMGERAPARELLSEAVSIDPRNQPALSRLVEMDIHSKNVTDLGANLPKLLRMRRPSMDVLTRAQMLLRSDSYLFLSNRQNLLHELASALNRTKSNLVKN